MRYWNFRVWCLWLNLLSLVEKIPVRIWRVIIPIPRLRTQSGKSYRLISHFRSYPPHCTHLHSPSHSLLSTTVLSLQNTQFSHSSSPLYTIIISWYRVQALIKYRIHRVQHTPRIVYIPYLLMIMSWHLNLASVSRVPHYTIDCHHPGCHASSKVKSPCHVPMFASELTDEWNPSTWHSVHWFPTTACPISLDRGLQSVLPNSQDYCLNVCMVMASMHMSKLAGGRSCSIPLRSLHHTLQVYLLIRLITASKCITKLAWLRTPTAHYHVIQVHLQTRPITASKCAPSWTASESANMLERYHRVHLYIHSFTAAKCISNYAWWPPPSLSLNMLVHGLGVYLCVYFIVTVKSISNCSHASSTDTPDRLCVHGLLYIYIAQNTNWIHEF